MIRFSVRILTRSCLRLQFDFATIHFDVYTAFGYGHLKAWYRQCFDSKPTIIPDNHLGTLSDSLAVSRFKDTETLLVSLDARFFQVGAHPTIDLYRSCGLTKQQCIEKFCN